MPDSHRSATRWLVIVLAGASAALWMAAQRTRDRRLLINQLTSRVPGSAAEAVRVLRFYGWLRPADLQTAAADGANLWLADLSRLDLGGIDLSRTNLTQADLSWSHLTGAILEQSNLADANLTRARLEAAALAQANLAGTNQRFARQERATLIGADLRGADLRAAP
ncbi:MAG: pentapeptide repeat-containing protein, partial [Anaerolineae bacterium]